MDILHLFHARTVEQVTGIETDVTAEMYRRLELWCDMAAGEAPWNAKARSCGVLAQIASRISSLVAREVSVGFPQGSAIEGAMRRLDARCDAIAESIALFGGCVVRPLFAEGALQFELLSLGRYLPTSYSFDGTLRGAVLLKILSRKERRWLLSEHHEFDGESHSVDVSLYSLEGGMKKVPLSDCPMAAGLTPSFVWRNCKMPMIVEFRNGAANRIDGSSVPVPIIAGAENLIRDADEQYERMIWEQEGGALRVFADRDLFARRTLRDGTAVSTELAPKLHRLVTMIDGDGSAEGKRITAFAPQLRTEAQNAALQQIFRRIELATGIGKGTISDAEAVQQTATQYAGGRAELYALVDKMEEEIEAKYKRCAEVFAYMAAAYGLGANDARIEVKWNDDQTRKDLAQAKQLAMQEISAGVKNKWEYRRDFFGEDEAAAKAAVPSEIAAGGLFDLA